MAYENSSYNTKIIHQIQIHQNINDVDLLNIRKAYIDLIINKD